jgi:hypothetical protein
MAPKICVICGDNRALDSHDTCSLCATDSNLFETPQVDLSPDEQHRIAQETGEVFEGGPAGKL